MKTSFKTAMIPALAALVISGCGGEKQMAAPECVFPDAPSSPAPAWICDAPVEGVALSAVGYAQKSKAGNAFMKKMATADARVTLAQTFKTTVQNMIKQYAETTGAADAETVDQVNTSVSKLITNETLVGSRLFKSRTSPADGMYVLVGLDTTNVQEAAKESIATSMKNEQALWQQFKAKKAQDELAAEIAKMKE